MGVHDRRPDARGRDGDGARPRLARAGAPADLRRRARGSRTRWSGRGARRSAWAGAALDEPLVRLEAEARVEAVRVARVQDPAAVGERPVVDHLADELDAEPASAALVEDVDVGEVQDSGRRRTRRPARSRPAGRRERPTTRTRRVDERVLLRARAACGRSTASVPRYACTASRSSRARDRRRARSRSAEAPSPRRRSRALTRRRRCADRENDGSSSYSSCASLAGALAAADLAPNAAAVAAERRGTSHRRGRQAWSRRRASCSASAQLHRGLAAPPAPLLVLVRRGSRGRWCRAWNIVSTRLHGELECRIRSRPSGRSPFKARGRAQSSALRRSLTVALARVAIRHRAFIDRHDSAPAVGSRAAPAPRALTTPTRSSVRRRKPPWYSYDAVTTVSASRVARSPSPSAAASASGLASSASMPRDAVRAQRDRLRPGSHRRGRPRRRRAASSRRASRRSAPHSAQLVRCGR